MSFDKRLTIAIAKKDEEFIHLAKKYVSGFPVPNFWSSEKEEMLFCLFYVGYLLGKYQDDPEKYLNEDKL